MESSRIIVASLLLLLAFAATAEARLAKGLMRENACQQTCSQVTGTACSTRSITFFIVLCKLQCMRIFG